ncbi:MAG: hypothetical protein AAF961_09165 [Planctomycetota bacterium]
MLRITAGASTQILCVTCLLSHLAIAAYATKPAKANSPDVVDRATPGGFRAAIDSARGGDVLLAGADRTCRRREHRRPLL